jgi:hypothetical protein
MRKNAIILLVAVLQFLIIKSAKAQEVKISGELRLRYEMQHGYKPLGLGYDYVFARVLQYNEISLRTSVL